MILCTDGDFDLGATRRSDLLGTIGDQAKTRIFLSVLGLGAMTAKDPTFKLLADQGSGQYGTIRSRQDAETAPAPRNAPNTLSRVRQSPSH